MFGSNCNDRGRYKSMKDNCIYCTKHFNELKNKDEEYINDIIKMLKIQIEESTNLEDKLSISELIDKVLNMETLEEKHKVFKHTDHKTILTHSYGYKLI
jgi:hypothetical protein